MNIKKMRSLATEKLSFLFSLAFILLFLGLATTFPVQEALLSSLYPKNAVDAARLNRTFIMELTDVSDVMNEDGLFLEQPTQRQSTSWIGSGINPNHSYLGLRFKRSTLPSNAEIVSAYLLLSPAETNTSPLSIDFYTDRNSQSESFNMQTLPSARIAGEHIVTYRSNRVWRKGQYLLINVTKPVQESISKNSPHITIIGKNTSVNSKERQFFYSEPKTNQSPRLFVRYRYKSTTVNATNPTLKLTPTISVNPTNSMATPGLISPTNKPSSIPSVSVNPTIIVPTQTTSKGCIVTGCSGQICAEEDVATTCEYREEYACYRNARCERQSNGSCGWTMSNELSQCLNQSQ